MFVSKSWPGQQGLGRPLVGTGQSVKGVSEAGGLTTHSCWESSGRELESNPPGWRSEEPLEERRSRPGTRSQGPPRSQGTGESPQRAFLWEGVWFLLLHGDLSIGVVTPQSMQVGSERGCLLRAVLIKLSLVWFLPRTDASQRVHRTCLWRVSPMGLRASPPTTLSLRKSHPIFSSADRDPAPPVCRNLQGRRQCGRLRLPRSSAHNRYSANGTGLQAIIIDLKNCFIHTLLLY